MGVAYSFRDLFNESDMDILTWLFVGLVGGVLASMVMGGTGYGLIGDIIIGIVGAFVGGWILRTLGTSVPVSGLPGIIIVAFIGAMILFLILRRFGRSTGRVPWPARRRNAKRVFPISRGETLLS